MKRREFLRHSAAATGALTFLPFTRIVAAKLQKKFANDIVTLGKTGIKVSRLAMGTGTHGVNRRSNQTQKLGLRGLADLLQRIPAASIKN